MDKGKEIKGQLKAVDILEKIEEMPILEIYAIDVPAGRISISFNSLEKLRNLANIIERPVFVINEILLGTLKDKEKTKIFGSLYSVFHEGVVYRYAEENKKSEESHD